MRMAPRAVLLALGICCALPAPAACVATVAGQRELAGDAALALRWIERGMDDGKPLVLRISERAGTLHLRFDKTGEGLWAEGSTLVCAEQGRLAVVAGGNAFVPGPAAPWLLRQALAAGARFELSLPSGRLLQVSAAGWRGAFVPDEARPGVQ